MATAAVDTTELAIQVYIPKTPICEYQLVKARVKGDHTEDDSTIAKFGEEVYDYLVIKN